MIEPDKKNIGENKSTHTYSEDLARSVKEKGGEAFRIARGEQQAREREVKIAARRKMNSLLLGLGGAALLLAGLALVLVFSSKPSVRLNPQPATAQSIIFYDSQKVINVAGLNTDKVLAAFRSESGSSALAAGKIENVIFSVGGNIPLGTGAFLNLLGANPPKEMLPFLNQNYFAGIFNDGSANWPFLVFQTNSYADISPLIINWENSLLDDLGGLLGIDVSGSNAYLLQSKFSDLIISNKETRAIKDKNGNIVLMYLFLDDQNILIARNKATLDEVLLRLYSPKK